MSNARRIEYQQLLARELSAALRPALTLLLALVLVLGVSARAQAGRATLNLVLVIDGLRPDSITPEDTPNLWRLRRDGVDFTNSHAVFPTVTRVNATDTGGTVNNFAGGVIDGARHGIAGNNPITVSNSGSITGHVGAGINMDTGANTTTTSAISCGRPCCCPTTRPTSRSARNTSGRSCRCMCTPTTSTTGFSTSSTRVPSTH